MRCICDGSRAILSSLLTVDTLLCGGGGAGREGRGVAFLNFLRDVNDILYQGDYDGSGQQSCKCNYVDFSE